MTSPSPSEQPHTPSEQARWDRIASYQPAPQDQAAQPEPYKGMRVLHRIFGGFTCLTFIAALLMIFGGNSDETLVGLMGFVATLLLAAIWGAWSLLIDIATELKHRR